MLNAIRGRSSEKAVIIRNDANNFLFMISKRIGNSGRSEKRYRIRIQISINLIHKKTGLPTEIIKAQIYNFTLRLLLI